MALRLADIPRLSNAADLELAARRVVEGLYAGRHRSPYTGSAVEFSDHRAYQPGDDLRAVDWKAYARSDHLLIRRFREERDLPLVLCLDSSASMDYGTPAKRDWAALAAATLALLAIDQGDRVRLVVGGAQLGEVTPALGGPAGLARLVAAVSAVRWEGAGDLPRLLTDLARRLERRAMIVLISDVLSDPVALSVPLGALAARGHEVATLQVLDRSELSLPGSWGRAVLEDPESVVPPLTCDTAEAKARYDALIATHIQSVRVALAACRGDHVLCPTDEPHGDVLGAWLRRRKVR